jgi:hypothetical protein
MILEHQVEPDMWDIFCDPFCDLSCTTFKVPREDYMANEEFCGFISEFEVGLHDFQVPFYL